MSENLPAVRGLTIPEIKDIAGAFAASGFFSDSKGLAQAFTKMVAGQELGIGPMQSMTGINIIKGKVGLSAGLVGALVKRSGKYDYKVVRHSASECSIEFFQNGELIGVSEFTMDDAKAAGLLSNETYKKYPRNMLLSRALTNGARWYTPDVFCGAVYTPDELGAAVDEDGDVIEVQAVEVSESAPTGASAGSEPQGVGASIEADAADESSDPAATTSSQSDEAAQPGAAEEQGAADAAKPSPTISQETYLELVKAAQKQGLNHDEFKSLVYGVAQKTQPQDVTVEEAAAIAEAILAWTPPAEGGES